MCFRTGAFLVSLLCSVRSLQMADPRLVSEAVSWCVAHGAVYALPATDAAKLGEAYSDGGVFSHAPFALGPYPWPKAEFDKVVSLQPALSAAIDRVSRDDAWLEHTLRETIASDEFTARIYQLHRDNPNPQMLRLGLLRSDYMLDQKESEGRSLQVEINTIASSFACLSETVAALHRYLAAKATGDIEALPSNGAGRGLAAGIAAAHKAYSLRRPNAGTLATAMVVQPGERNQMDQRKLEHNLFDEHGVRLLRVTLRELADRALLATDGALLFDDFEISVVYYRAGYSPDDYASDVEWAARAKVERSLAIKCPSAAYQLAGTKKVQQALATPGELEKFAQSTDEASAMRAVFAGLYDLDEAAPNAADAVRAALADPDNFVLKPQREGGGNNLYGSDLAKALNELTSKQRAAFILMERIVGMPVKGALVRNGVAIYGDCTAELGVYGVYLADGPDAVLLNHACGHLVRQKLLGVNEGGVAAGFAVLSSPKLT